MYTPAKEKGQKRCQNALMKDHTRDGKPLFWCETPT